MEVWDAITNYRTDLNLGDVERINGWVSDDFIGYFGYYNDVDYRVYRGQEYRDDNVQTFIGYQGKNPTFEYNDLTYNLRKHDELILTATIDFYLEGQNQTTVLTVEVFKKETTGWKLYRQHMEHYG
ncbi:DUF4440 domain-containing protein [Geomicrobium sediminis]|uniref:Ketosteroid isomerase-like protein n=1 Tax=Geomicrobium sediminis TaxID=1347788 RepID=A0ABS2PAI0_9BACL|nr:DUF4440 domain-containing protein [Geomicrobium sediminis]MBM7632366.1 ketosteroid isomerase-like protein [Geomicrobium sediminis]